MNISLFVISSMHSTASQVFLCLVWFIILWLYQLIEFLDNCRHLKEHLRSYWIYTRLSFCVTVIYSYWEVTIPRTSNVFSVYGQSQIKIIRQYGVNIQINRLESSAKTVQELRIQVCKLKRYTKTVQETQDILDNRTRSCSLPIYGRLICCGLFK